MVDETMNTNVNDPDFSKFDRSENNGQIIELIHIMSKKPFKYLDKFAPYSDVIFI